MMLSVGALCALADNTVSVSKAFIPKGKTGSFSIDLANTDAFASSMEIHLTLPEGITFGSVVLGNRFTDNPTVASSLSGQNVTITTLSATNAAISGSSGPLLYVTVSADEALEVGTQLTASVTMMELAKKVGDKHEKWNPEPFSFDIEITDRVILDENSTFVPIAQSGVNVLVNRTIKAGLWSTICLPFALTKAKAEAAFGSDVELAEFTGFEVDYGDDEENVVPLGITINLDKFTMTSKKGMAAGKPFLIKVSEDKESFTADEVNIISEVTDVSKPDENDTPGKFTGTFVKTVIPADGLFISDNQFWYSTGKTNVKAFRCWFELGAVLDKETDFGARVFLNFVDDETTGISNYNSKANANDAWYTLDGRLLDKKPAEKGIYIRNNKKVVIQ